MEYINGSLKPFNDKEFQKFKLFEKEIQETHKEGNLLLLYRGESLKGLKKRLFHDDSSYELSKLYERIFVLGEKAKHFYEKRVNLKDRNYLISIDDISRETFEFIFNRISNLLKEESLSIKINGCVSTRFKEFFLDDKNIEKFADSILSEDNNSQIKIRDYFLFFLHTAASKGVKEQTFFVSTSTDKNIANDFAGDRHGRGKIIFHFYIPRPFSKFAVSPWMIAEHHDLVFNVKLPTYQPTSLFPEQKEIAVKASLSPRFLIGVQNFEENHLFVNPYISEIDPSQYDSCIRSGIPIKQDKFMEIIEKTNYMRWVNRDAEGNFSQYEKSNLNE